MNLLRAPQFAAALLACSLLYATSYAQTSRGITPLSFTNQQVISLLPAVPIHLNKGDLDGDGKTDLVVVKHVPGSKTDSGFVVLRNTTAGSGSSFSFDNGIVFPLYNCTETAIADLDGDGRNDIVAGGGDSVLVYRNTSTPGHISFAAPVRHGVDPTVGGLAICDLDGDGKADIAALLNEFTTYEVTTLTIFKNNSTPGNLQLAWNGGSFNIGVATRFLHAVDLNNDGKPDLLGNVYRLNKSSAWGFDFSNAVDQLLLRHNVTAPGDIDGDGFIDQVLADSINGHVRILRNETAGAVVRFSKPLTLQANAGPDDLAIADLDGDGKPDIAAALANYRLGIIQNSSAPGVLSFQSMVAIGAGNFNGTRKVLAADLNNDGRADLLTSSASEGTLTIFLNEVKATPVIYSFSPTIGEDGTVITIKGDNFTGVTGVTIGGKPASWNVQSPGVIVATVPAGAAGEVTVTNAAGAYAWGNFINGLPPVIHTVTPLRAAVGATVTITGDRFDPVAANNHVYFGGVKAAVIAASAKSLSVRVPAGIGFAPVSVTARGKTATSRHQFSATFPGAVDTFSRTSLALPWEINSGVLGAMADIDGDGRPDMLCEGHKLQIARNLSEPGSFEFATLVTLHASYANHVRAADLNGDGLQDVIAAVADSIAIWQNSSTPGNIQFKAPVYYKSLTNGDPPVPFVVQDFDGDGKLDIVAGEGRGAEVPVWRNTSSQEQISLAPAVNWGIRTYAGGLAVADLDNDGKVELLIAGGTGWWRMCIYPNLSTPGLIDFGAYQEFVMSPAIPILLPTDLDGDDKIDLVVDREGASGSIGVMRNTSTPGKFVFSEKISKGLTHMGNMTLGDLDGDGKAEILSAVGGGFSLIKSFAIMKQVDSGAGPVFQDAIEFPMSQEPVVPMILDVDGDGMPDVVMAGGSTTSIYRNILGKAAITKFCSNGAASLACGVAGKTFQWQRKTDAGFVNIADNVNYSGVTTATLKLSAIPNAWDKAAFRCVIDGVVPGILYELKATASVTPAVTIKADKTSICAGAPVTFTATPVNGGFQPDYAWKKNGWSYGTNNAVYTEADIKNNDEVEVILTTKALCAVSETATSNKIKIIVDGAVATVRITGNTIVEAGKSSTMTVTIENGGASPAIQWQDSTTATGWVNIPGATASTFNYFPAADRVRLRVVVSSNAPCVTTNPWISKSVQFSLTAVTAIGGEPAINRGIRYYPNPVINELVIDSLRLSDQWESVAINSLSGSPVIAVQKLIGLVRLSVPVGGLARGYYVAVLRRKQGAPVYIRFLKL